MKILIVLFIFALGSLAHADVLLGAGIGASFEQDSNTLEYKPRTQLLLRGGYRFQQADFFLEYSYFQAKDGVEILETNRTHNEWIAWVKREIDSSWILTPTLAVGAGFQYDNIKTTFDNEASSDSGTPELLIATAAGVRVKANQNLDFQLEGRMAFSQGYAPNPLFGLNLAVGFYF